jgi:hypothetical protein
MLLDPNPTLSTTATPLATSIIPDRRHPLTRGNTTFSSLT